LKIVADESVDGQIVSRLRAEGYSVQFIAEVDPAITDEAVLQRSREAGALLLTADKDFGELVFRQQLLHSGVVLIRLAGLDPEARAELVAKAFAEHAEHFPMNFAVLSKRGTRLRYPLA
jgi:predicted nuclease of predicted toxin-antitoxin system